MPSIVLGSKNTVVDKVDQVSFLIELTFNWEQSEYTSKHMHKIILNSHKSY